MEAVALQELQDESLPGQLVLSDEQVAFFRTNGYLVLRGITDLKDLASLRDIYERMFLNKTGMAEGNYFDLNSAGNEVKVLPQMTQMAHYEPRLRDTTLWRNVGAVSRQLLGPTAEFIFDHGIRKPPQGPATRWHQDHAFYGPGTRYQSVTFWVPLHDATIENGCMWFVPGSNRGPLLTHQSLDNNPAIHALEIIDSDISKQAVACPIKAGDCTIHHPLTIHGTGPNLTDEPRLAYGLAFGTRLRRSVVRREFPWNAAKDTERKRRHYASLSPLGKLKHFTSVALVRAGLH
jgi:ectoine hydroxylase-related dioxygenase (phytanoyl-CoA dioxygenase family)